MLIPNTLGHVSHIDSSHKRDPYPLNYHFRVIPGVSGSNSFFVLGGVVLPAVGEGSGDRMEVDRPVD